MDNTREKLIELLETVVSPKELLCCGEVLVSTSRVADHLIANGVTFATDNKWIPVTERLPEMRDDGFADAFLVTNGCLGHIAYFVDGEWIFTDNGEMKEPMFYGVTHWMPLPEPPHEE